MGARMTNMSTEQLFKEKLKRIYDCTGSKTQKELAAALGVQQSTISSLQKKQSIPDSWLITLLKKYSVNIEWIENAVEPKYLYNTSDAIYNNNQNKLEKTNFTLNENKAFNSQPNLGAKRVAIYSSLYKGEVDEKNNKIFDIHSYMTLPDVCIKNSLLFFQYNNKNMQPAITKDAIIGIDSSVKDIEYGEIMAFCFPQQGISLYRVFHSSLNLNEDELMLDLVSDEKLFPKLTQPYNTIKNYFLGKVNWTLNVF